MNGVGPLDTLPIWRIASSLKSRLEGCGDLLISLPTKRPAQKRSGELTPMLSAVLNAKF